MSEIRGVDIDFSEHRSSPPFGGRTETVAKNSAASVTRAAAKCQGSGGLQVIPEPAHAIRRVECEQEV